MGQTASQIEAHIEHTREDLGSNLDQLERKVKSAADWRRLSGRGSPCGERYPEEQGARNLGQRKGRADRPRGFAFQGLCRRDHPRVP
jgi:hypothetical protein